jgi:hypothetical protein
VVGLLTGRAKASYRTDGQHERKGGERTNGGMGHKADGIFANEQLAGLFPDDGNLLIACVKIATYN